MEKEKTRTCEIFIDELGILHVKILAGVIIDKEDAADNFVVVRNLTEGKPILKLVDARNPFIIKKDAQIFVEKENDPNTNIARAVLVNSFITKYLRAFFLRLEKPKVPVKIFTSEKKALEWLKTFL
jgi:hypothetical protein